MPIAIHDDLPSTVEPEAQGSSSSFPDLEHFRVQGIPPAAYYVPEFITEDEEEFLLRKYWGGNMSKNGVLLPEPFPDWLIGFPNIVERIEHFLADSSATAPSFNQVLINEYQPGQGISPHEDGPAFKPLVATLSLGSHIVLDIHHYASTVSPSPPMTATISDDATPRVIAASPLAHLLVMPRSLLVLSSSLYTSHLHGIRGKEKDEVHAGEEGKGDRIVNAELLGQAEIGDALREGSWTAERGVRTSLTFRTAEKTVKGGAFSLHRGGMKKA